MVRATERPSIPREHPDAYWDPYKQFTGSRITPLNTDWHIHITSPQENKQTHLWGFLLGPWGSTEGGQGTMWWVVLGPRSQLGPRRTPGGAGRRLSSVPPAEQSPGHSLHRISLLMVWVSMA